MLLGLKFHIFYLQMTAYRDDMYFKEQVDMNLLAIMLWLIGCKTNADRCGEKSVEISGIRD